MRVNGSRAWQAKQPFCASPFSMCGAFEPWASWQVVHAPFFNTEWTFAWSIPIDSRLWHR